MPSGTQKFPHVSEALFLTDGELQPPSGKMDTSGEQQCKGTQMCVDVSVPLVRACVCLSVHVCD